MAKPNKLSLLPNTTSTIRYNSPKQKGKGSRVGCGFENGKGFSCRDRNGKLGFERTIAGLRDGRVNMWHEARKQEKKLRETMVNYQKRAERRREHYDKLVSCYDVLYLKIVLMIIAK